MTTFREAYIKLTAFYVGIIMIISLLFSVWVYNEAVRELNFGLVARFDEIGRQVQVVRGDFIEQRLQEGRGRILFNLTILNLAVLGGGAAASYFLARRTMQPIEEAMKAKDRFTADASHELRTPLAAMKAEIEVSLRDKKRSKADIEALLESNLEEINRLSHLAEGLLVLTNEEQVKHETVQLDAVIERVVERFIPLANMKNIAINSQLTPMQLLSNAQDIDKIISILLDNAIKYSPEKTEVKLAVVRQSDQVVVTVTDQGFGIKAMDLPHIFDRFYRADASRSKQHISGHGLGLSIAQKLAQRLGGVILVKSQAGGGSTFSLSLPL